MKIATLAPSCPKCGAHKIVYSCEPKCCFNHVCSSCRAQFQLQTRELGSKLSLDLFPTQLPAIDSCEPTAQCANCESLKVYEVDSTESSSPQIVCAECGSLLELFFAEED